MPPRAIWKGVIAFGKIRTPVKLYAAASEERVSFHLLHDEDNVRLRQQMVCELDGQPVPPQERVKGLEIDDGVYVLLEPEDLEQLEPESHRTIAVTRFVPADDLDARFLDRPYHLGPDGESAKYAALAAALAGSGRIGVCQWSFRRRSYSGVLRGSAGVLSLVTVRLQHELRPASELDLATPSLSAKERTMARYLVDEMTADFDPSRYHNDFQQALRDLIRTKAEGGTVRRRKAPRVRPTESDQLLAALEASLADARAGKAAHA